MRSAPGKTSRSPTLSSDRPDLILLRTHQNVAMPSYSRPNRLFVLSSALLAFVMWGGWAFYINRTANHITSLKAGLIQGSASFIITLLMVHSVTWLSAQCPKSHLQLWLPALITVGFTGSCLVIVHYLGGTPHIFRTVAPPLSIAFLFCLFTAYKLRKQH